MNIGEVIRKTGFTGYDYMKGRSVSSHLDDLDLYFLNPRNYEAIQRERLSMLLKSACDTVEFYKQYKGTSAIGDFPIIQKTQIQRLPDEFISQTVRRSKLKIATTSGSYGTPMNFYQNAEKWDRRSAEVIYFNNWAGYEVGMKHALIKARPKSAIKLFIENEHLIRPLKMDANFIEKQLELLIKKKVEFIIGYPSVLSAFANYYKDKYRQPLPYAFKGVITYAEPTYKEARKSIEEIFRCPVLSRYSMEEFGVVAHQCSLGNKFHLNQAGYFIETIALGKDRPAAVGEPGRVVITDLFSHAMPLIRYDTGDIAILGRNCSCGLSTQVFDRIEGRVTEIIYDTQGRTLSPLIVVTPIAKSLKGIMQFQLIQTSKKNYTLNMVISSIFPSNETHKLIDKLKEILGEDAAIELKYVSSIKPLPSGKRPFIVNEYRKNRIIWERSYM